MAKVSAGKQIIWMLKNDTNAVTKQNKYREVLQKENVLKCGAQKTKMLTILWTQNLEY